MVTRRGFLGSACAAALGGRFGAFAGDAGGTPILKFGVLSDVHLNANGDETHFVKALQWFRDQGADAVMIAGDIADTGRIDQLECMANCWFGVFPNNKAPDGRTVERLFVYGNHDVEGWTYVAASTYPDDASKRAQVIGFENNRALVWQRLFDEEYAPVWKKSVKGITFIGAHWLGQHCPQIEDYMAAHAAEIDPALPFFYTQHSHPQNTCYGPWAWGHDPGYATRALAPFANAVAFSGHSHYTLTDERSVWQGAFTSIGTATLRRTSLDYACVENSNGNDFNPAQKAWGRAKSMQSLYREDGKQGMMVDVYADHLVLHRRDFVYDGSLGADWTVSIPSATAAPVYSFATRAALRSAPAFAANAQVTVLLLATPPACAVSGTQGAHAYVTFPAAHAVNGCRVFQYEVKAVDAAGTAIDTRVVMAPGFNLPESEGDRAGECIFPLRLFAAGATIRFEVRPMECLGTKGAAIVSEPVTIPGGTGGGGGTMVDADPDSTYHWRTCADGRTTLNWTTPEGARSAKLTITGLRGREEHVFGSLTESYDWRPKGAAEDVYELKLEFFSSDAATGTPLPGKTLVARGVGKVRTSGVRVLPRGVEGPGWTGVAPHNVAALPRGTTGVARNGVAQTIGAAPCWFGLDAGAEGAVASWSLAGAAAASCTLRGVDPASRIHLR